MGADKNEGEPENTYNLITLCTLPVAAMQLEP